MASIIRIQPIQVEEILMRTAVPVRLTPQQQDLIWRGINRIALAYITHKETGSSVYSYPFRVHPMAIHPRRGDDPGTFDIVKMQMILELWSKLQKRRKKRARLVLGMVELSACILSVRVGRDYERIVLKKKHTSGENRIARAVIHSLERELKRARRAYAAETGEPAYKAMRARWFAHLRWIRMHLAYFRPTKGKTQIRRVQKMIIDYGCERATRGLLLRKLEPPQDLRRLVRLAVRYIRRGRIRLFIQQLTNNPPFAAEFLANFIEARRDLIPIQNQNNKLRIGDNFENRN
jgi:hypothetical protein